MISLVIAEDQKILRGALGTLLDFEENLTVIGQAQDGEEALRLIHQLKPDVCILDIEMPKKSGLDVADDLKTAGSSCKVVILTTFARPGYFERALRADVRGYLLKDGSIDELANAIKNVMIGKREFSSELVMGHFSNDNPLTKREQEVLSYAANGLTSKEIGTALYLSPGTVRNYLSEILQKVGAKNKVEALVICRKKGWLD
ncbi:response regulator transcription factor [Sporosarcina aquimarina]|uniref:response regulator transcription factor n=1 Tax=Sporosarcina aquimarina TaxID=114975 RepID=UPI00203FE15C|nr:response regulator transcription factor [Sporosarcina aquimarina]MCM3756260.1 response regulator transcription factor [Sporosarcina aquimarina]